MFLELYRKIENGADIVLSDMAPNMSGTLGIDQPRAMYLSELALDMARRVLKKGGSFVVKVFQGVGSQEFLRELHQDFETVKVRKPDASRDRSREVYMVATGFKGHELNGIAPELSEVENATSDDYEQLLNRSENSDNEESSDQ